MALSTYPDRYLLFNTQQTKNIAVVVSIDGIDLLSNIPIYERVRYGDPDTVYGEPGLVYGGLRQIRGNRDIMSLDGSSLTIGQRIEPEQGRAAVTLMTLVFIDKDGYLTSVIQSTRGLSVNEILGKKVRIYLGYQQTSFPQDFFTVFRGFLTGVRSDSGIVTFQLSDSSVKRRQQVYVQAKSTLSSGISDSTSTIPITSTSDFPQQILGPDATYDTTVKTFIKIDSEWMEYGSSGIGSGVITVLSRGARGTTAVAHTGGAEVSSAVELTDIALDIALKTMLSGWNGPYSTGNALYAIRSTGDPDLGDQPNSFVLSLDLDAVEDLGLAVGDYFTISGSTAGNDGTGLIIEIQNWGDLRNRVIKTSLTFNAEPNPTPAVVSFRSQFDTYPLVCGLKMDPTDVDVPTHVQVKNDFLASDVFQFFIQTTQTGKSFLESEIYLPEGIYPVSRYGKLSVNITRPPIVGQVLAVLDKDSVLEPDKISISRSLNNRRFFNEIKYEYDLSDDGRYQTIFRLLDSDSLSIIGVSSVLPIKSAGMRSNQSGNLIASRRGRFLLLRYKDAAIELPVKVNWEAGSIIETGDVIVLKDEGNLQISNFSTGERDLGIQLFEVIDRKVDIKTGEVTLQLLSGLGFDLTDRYATIAPSSLTDTGSTTTSVRIKESFGEVFPLQEQKKWTDYVGLPIVVHNYDWSVEEQVTFTGLDPGDDHALLVSPPLSFTPPADYIVDIAPYPTGTDPAENELYKIVHAFFSPTATVVSGISAFQFTVSAPDAALFHVGLNIIIHNYSWSTTSNEVTVSDVTGTTITVATTLGFTPSAGQSIDGIGFNDGRGFYRII